MRREHRLRASRDFRRVIESGNRMTGREFVLYHFAGDAASVPRVGFAVPRRVGGAVVRNRARRLLREAARPLLPQLLVCDIVVVALPAIREAGAVELTKALGDAAARAGLLRT